MNNIVESNRTIYTPSKFAKESLIYLQEVGTSKTYKQHTNSRKYMNSYLLFVVIKGDGILCYNDSSINMKQGDCAFIDCHKSYSHSSDNWMISWIHFNGNNVKGIYNKFLEREEKNVFSTKEINKYNGLLNDIYMISNSNDYTRDINIFSKISELLCLAMSQTIYPEEIKRKHKYNIDDIKKYIDTNYKINITLNDLSKRFYINKFYLTRAFKDNYGTTINNYILEKRITKAKELLRFSDKKIEEISFVCGIDDPNYFSRVFKKIEGITPKEYKQMW